MIVSIDNGKHVKIIFKNGTIIEGLVQEWVSNYIQLESLSDKSIMIIAHPEEDIMLVKVMPDDSKFKNENTPELIHEQIREKLQQVKRAPENVEEAALQEKSIAELKQMVVDQDRKLVQKKLTEHRPASAYLPHKANYGNQINILTNPNQNKMRNGGP